MQRLKNLAPAFILTAALMPACGGTTPPAEEPHPNPPGPTEPQPTVNPPGPEEATPPGDDNADDDADDDGGDHDHDSDDD